MPLIRFGDGARSYDFTRDFVFLQDYSDNFSDLVNRVVRVPGVSGGFDEYGDDPTPQEIGQLSQRLILKSPTREGMEVLRDEIKAMQRWGKLWLYMRPSNPALPVRKCRARINNIQISKQEQGHTDLHQRVSLTFQVPFPVWFTDGTEPLIWGGGGTWGGGGIWGGTSGFTASGVETDEVITISGNAVVQPRIVIECDASQTCEDPTIQTIVGGEVVDEVSYTGTLGNNDSLEINCRALSVLLNGNNAYSSTFDFNDPSWIRLYQGDNTVRVTFANSGDEATIRMFYNEGYY